MTTTFKNDDQVKYKYTQDGTNLPEYWSAKVTRILEGSKYVIKFDGFLVPETSELGRPGPRGTEELLVDEWQITPYRHTFAVQDPSLHRILWDHSKQVWRLKKAAHAAASAAREAEIRVEELEQLFVSKHELLVTGLGRLVKVNGAVVGRLVEVQPALERCRIMLKERGGGFEGLCPILMEARIKDVELA